MEHDTSNQWFRIARRGEFQR